MKEPIIRLMLFIRDLLDYDEQLIKRGRVNEEQENSETDYIAVDSLAPAQPISQREFYDGDNEKMTYGTKWRQVFTINFYGLGAYVNASKLQLLIKSQPSIFKQFQHKITVCNVSQLTDVKQLTGQQYVNRFELELAINYDTEVDIDILRIDKVSVNIKTDVPKTEHDFLVE